MLDDYPFLSAAFFLVLFFYRFLPTAYCLLFPPWCFPSTAFCQLFLPISPSPHLPIIFLQSPAI
ncbi:MAG: hypothetical protein Q7U55_07470, partial [Deltaproteobacteria bacterium]|nr:hypothetical protein [Deltaproteobacteria bacterium]